MRSQDRFWSCAGADGHHRARHAGRPSRCLTLKKHGQNWSRDSIASALDDDSQYRIELRETDPPGQFALALRYKLTACDAAYLWLAAELKAPLATFDENLAPAARAHGASLSGPPGGGQ
ncbi:MAG: hypothetical protein JWP65_2217 [Ramlibacter sp.]|jgi:hypothetical protein|uniref:type II toxin-antitoxin system VapC family toxin n=1 Tax=Ramlibacter sp. TaxID=1917967 RepID=UPI0026131816|nr:type II toxin-antitoxin system VapC family toxin [Ramlibacter sp.]MDB5751796.1 hypothetical protein [Ramlibacter sp.]